MPKNTHFFLIFELSSDALGAFLNFLERNPRLNQIKIAI